MPSPSSVARTSFGSNGLFRSPEARRELYLSRISQIDTALT